MDVLEFLRPLTDFNDQNHPEKIKTFGWFLHVHLGLEYFQAADIRKCYDDASISKPADTYRFLVSLTQRKPPDLLKTPQGFRLAKHVRDQMDARYGRLDAVVTVEKMLADLPGRISDDGERLFLSEVLVCYKHSAFRAAIVMVWNLAYDHLCRWVLADPARLAAFNAGIGKRNSKKAHVVIATRDDFEDLKEDEMVDIVGGVPGVSINVKRLLKEKLGRRNTAAHPSLLVILRPQVDDMITDLVTNVVLAFPLPKTTSGVSSSIP